MVPTAAVECRSLVQEMLFPWAAAPGETLSVSPAPAAEKLLGLAPYFGCTLPSVCPGWSAGAARASSSPEETLEHGVDLKGFRFEGVASV